jgi:hypothetical protein
MYAVKSAGGQLLADRSDELLAQQGLEVIDAVDELAAHAPGVEQRDQEAGLDGGDDRGVAREGGVEGAALGGQRALGLGEEGVEVGQGQDAVGAAVLEERQDRDEDLAVVDRGEVEAVLGLRGEQVAAEVLGDRGAPGRDLAGGGDRVVDLGVAARGVAGRRGAIDREGGAALGVLMGEQPGQVDVDGWADDGPGPRRLVGGGRELDLPLARGDHEGAVGGRAGERDQLVLELEGPPVLDDGGDDLLAARARAEGALDLAHVLGGLDLAALLAQEATVLVGDQAQRHRAGLGPGAQLGGLGGGEADGLERLDEGGDRGAGDELREEELVVVAVGDVGRPLRVAGVVEDGADVLPRRFDPFGERALVVARHGRPPGWLVREDDSRRAAGRGG